MPKRVIDLSKKTEIFLNDKILTQEPSRISRYHLMAKLIRIILGDSGSILDVGGKEGLLREFKIKTTILDQLDSGEDNYVKGDALNMPFTDNSYDMTVSCDVLEHIPKNGRKKFIEEMVRVSQNYIIIGAPCDSKAVKKSEIEANKFYKKISSKDHQWLVEHIENGLPDKMLIEKYIKDTGLNYDVFGHLSLDIWNKTTRLHFLNAVFGDSKAIELASREIFKRYSEDIINYDFGENSYRTFFVISKKEDFSLKLPDNTKRLSIKDNFISYLNDKIIEITVNLAIEKRSAVNRLNKKTILANQLQNEIDHIKNSKHWKIYNKIYPSDKNKK
jgi:hypothetical protein